MYRPRLDWTAEDLSKIIIIPLLDEKKIICLHLKYLLLASNLPHPDFSGDCTLSQESGLMVHSYSCFFSKCWEAGLRFGSLIELKSLWHPSPASLLLLRLTAFLDSACHSRKVVIPLEFYHSYSGRKNNLLANSLKHAGFLMCLFWLEFPLFLLQSILFGLGGSE